MVALAAAFTLYKYQWSRPADEGSAAPTGLEAALDPVTGQTIGEKMPQTNPFAASVNPYELYQNPFKK